MLYDQSRTPTESRTMHFDEDQAKVREKFATEVERDLKKLVAEYRKEFDDYLCTDNALNLCQDYREGTREQKARYADAIGESVSKIVNGVYEQMLREPASKGRYNSVLFIASGPGSGKTSAIENTLGNVKAHHQIVYEVVMGLSQERIDKAHQSGKVIRVQYVH